MKAEVRKKLILNNLPSASGIEIVGKLIYIIGDDSPFLYILDNNYQQLDKLELFKTTDFITGRIPKLLKADLECITSININQKKHLFICGSASNENRETAFLLETGNNLATGKINTVW